jgi:putative redox protein
MHTYKVQVDRIDQSHARATVRDFSLTLGALRADSAAGFNPVETLLSAVGDCLLTALDYVAAISRVPIAQASVEVNGVRQDKPPTLTEIHFLLRIASDAPDERIQRMVELARANSTVIQTMAMAVPVEGGWVRA